MTVRTSPSKRRLSELARHLVLPSGIKTTGFPPVCKLGHAIGINWDPWQEGLLTGMLGKRADGLYAAGTGGVALSICRQTGKTFTIGSLAICLAALTPGMKILWTAHRIRTASETFNSLAGVCENGPLKGMVDHVRRANGQQEIGFRNGARILFGAREQGFGRGFDNISLEVFDEAQILTERALSDMEPATNTAKNPLIVYMGTPPRPEDPGDVFTHLRKQALDGTDGIMYVEFSADRDAKPDDRAQWAKANPSYPTRTGEGAMLRMLSSLGPDTFRREALGIWDETEVKAAISPQQWEKTTVPGKPEDATPAIGIDMTPDRSALAIGCCWRKGDTAHVQLVRYEDPHTKGTEWAVQWVADRWSKLSAVVIDAQSPAMTLLPDLQAARVRVTVTRTLDLARACGHFTDMLAAGKLTHRPDSDQPALAQAVKGATTRPVGPAGAFAWNRRDRDTDISPLMAVTLAIHGAWTSKRHPGRKQEMWS